MVYSNSKCVVLPKLSCKFSFISNILSIETNQLIVIIHAALNMIFQFKQTNWEIKSSGGPEETFHP